MLYGDYSKANHPADIVKAVERSDVAVAMLWGLDESVGGVETARRRVAGPVH